jgi:3,4-dihydroxy 2-butanone 4-phosphate synthase/GTP cyclohydrolase II
MNPDPLLPFAPYPTLHRMSEHDTPFDPIESAIAAIRDGGMAIVVDDEDRENEGDFVAAAEAVTPEMVNFMATEGRGLICVPLTAERAVELDLPMMVPANSSVHETAFTISVDLLRGTSTGISASDRAATIRALADPATRPAELGRPGHIFPLRAHAGGVLRRAGHTEAAVDLARLAGRRPTGVIVEILNADGTMARVPDLIRIARQHGLPLVTIKDLIAYRMRNERLVEEVVSVDMPTRHGRFTLTAFEERLTGEVHLALSKGTWDSETPVLTRVHSSCATGDIFGSARCDCGDQLAAALAQVEREGTGVVLYMQQEGRGIGLINKLRAYKLQEQGMDTVEANEALGFGMDLRDYGIGCQILRALGVRRMRLMTNNPRKRVGLSGYGLEIAERVPLEMPASEHNARYLRTKRDRMGHNLDLLGGASGHDRAVLGEVLES